MIKNLKTVWCILLVLPAYLPVVPALFAQEFVPIFGDASYPAAAKVPEEALLPLQPRIKFYNDVKVEKSRISLGDIADCDGEGALCEEMAHVDFGLSAPAGEKRVLNLNEIKAILASEFPDQRFDVIGSDKIIVSSAAQEIDKLQLEGYIQDYLQLKLRGKASLRMKFARVLFSKKIRILPSDFQIDIPAITDLNTDDVITINDQLSGRKVLEIICVYDDQGARKTEQVKASVHIELEQLLPILKTAKSQGSIIDHSDLDLKWVTLNRMNADAITEVKEIVNKRVRTSLHPGAHISPKSLEVPALVKRGTAVRVLISRNGLNVSGEAKAMASGAMGDMVKVFYVSTKKSLQAKVIGENLVEVSL